MKNNKLLKCYFLLIITITCCSSSSLKTDTDGFKEIFNGKSLKGWEGDPVYWKVADGVLIGEITPETILKKNSFIIWRKGITADFELKLDYRISVDGNSGVNYRSEWSRTVKVAN